MSLITKLAKRAPLGAALGLAAAIGFIPAQASANAIYGALASIGDIALATPENWILSTEVLSSTANSIVDVGNTTISASLSSNPGDACTFGGDCFVEEGGSADAPGGELDRSANIVISFQVTNTGNAVFDNTVLIDYELFAIASTTLALEEANALASIDVIGVGLGDEAIASIAAPGFDDDSAVDTLFVDVFGVLVGQSASFRVVLTAEGRAFSPGATPPPTPMPEPGSLSLLGLGLLATAYVRRRRNR